MLQHRIKRLNSRWQNQKGNSLIELAESIFANKIPDISAPKHIKLLIKM